VVESAIVVALGGAVGSEPPQDPRTAMRRAAESARRMGR